MKPWLIVVLLGLCVIVYTFIIPRRTQSNKRNDLVTEMEETIEHFANELEEENKGLVRLLTDLKEDYSGRTTKLLERIEFLERQCLELNQNIASIHRSNVADSSAVSATTLAMDDPASLHPPQDPPQTVQDVEEQSLADDIRQRYHQLFELYHHGKSIEYISKKLGMNTGEVQLIIRFASQEEPFRA